MGQDLVTLPRFPRPGGLFALVPGAAGRRRDPGFLGETHFPMLAYSDPVPLDSGAARTRLPALLGASSQSAKEVKIFGLGGYLAERYAQLFDQFYQENKALASSGRVIGSLLNLLPTAGYYGAYIVILLRTLEGAI